MKYYFNISPWCRPLDLSDLEFWFYEFNQEAFSEADLTCYKMLNSHMIWIMPFQSYTHDFCCITTKFRIEVKQKWAFEFVIQFASSISFFLRYDFAAVFRNEVIFLHWFLKLKNQILNQNSMDEPKKEDDHFEWINTVTQIST